MQTKETLAMQIAEKNGLTKEKSRSIVNDIFNTIANEVADGGTAVIHNFGTFKTSERKQRECVNPQTRKKMTVEARNVPYFKAGEGFKKAVRK